MHMKKGARSLIYLAPSFTCGPMRTLVWWSRGESNPRPQAISGQIYMRSWLIWISHPGPRSSTLLGMPVTRSCPVSCDPARGAADVDDLAVFGLAASGPAHRRAVARLAGVKRRGRNVRRSQLLRFQWIYERTGARHALRRIRTHVETWSAPAPRV